MVNRRTFLSSFAAAATLCAVPALSFARQRPEDVILPLFITNTGEKGVVELVKGGIFNNAAYEEACRLMWDWRRKESYPISHDLLYAMAALHTAAGQPEWIEVICGYRSPQTNARLRRRNKGISKRSFHMRGMAADVRLTGNSTGKTYRLASGLPSVGGVGFYPKNRFIHMDMGPPNRRW